MSNSLDQEYKKLSVKFLAASMREQLLILLCGVVVLVMAFYTLALEPQIDRSEKLHKNSIRADNELTVLQSQVFELTSQLRNDPNEPVRARIDLLAQQIQSITQQLNEQTNSLVPASKMASLLESVLAGSTGLKLIELQSIAPVPILFGDPDDSDSPQAGLYRHGVTLIFEGSYFDIQGYLEKLESLPWQFYWKKFDYQVDDYPTASVELEIYTLSTNKAFIGV